jgi:hypothetical protein
MPRRERLIVTGWRTVAQVREGLMSTFVFVPGEWLGGWCWLYVAADLRAAGNTVVDVTLTGLGERAHLLSREIELETHILRGGRLAAPS